jgi:hypothetical protein
MASINNIGTKKLDMCWSVMKGYSAELEYLEDQPVTVENSKDLIGIAVSRAGDLQAIEIMPDGAALGRPGMLFVGTLRLNDISSATVYVSAFPADTGYHLATTSPGAKSAQDRKPAFRVDARPSYSSRWKTFATFGELTAVLRAQLSMLCMDGDDVRKKQVDELREKGAHQMCKAFEELCDTLDYMRRMKQEETRKASEELCKKGVDALRKASEELRKKGADDVRKKGVAELSKFQGEKLMQLGDMCEKAPAEIQNALIELRDKGADELSKAYEELMKPFDEMCKAYDELQAKTRKLEAELQKARKSAASVSL